MVLYNDNISFIEMHRNLTMIFMILFLLGCSPNHVSLEINNRNIIGCFSMKAKGDCNDEQTIQSIHDYKGFLYSDF